LRSLETQSGSGEAACGLGDGDPNIAAPVGRLARLVCVGIPKRRLVTSAGGRSAPITDGDTTTPARRGADVDRDATSCVHRSQIRCTSFKDALSFASGFLSYHLSVRYPRFAAQRAVLGFESCQFDVSGIRISFFLFSF